MDENSGIRSGNRTVEEIGKRCNNQSRFNLRNLVGEYRMILLQGIDVAPILEKGVLGVMVIGLSGYIALKERHESKQRAAREIAERKVREDQLLAQTERDKAEREERDTWRTSIEQMHNNTMDAFVKSSETNSEFAGVVRELKGLIEGKRLV